MEVIIQHHQQTDRFEVLQRYNAKHINFKSRSKIIQTSMSINEYVVEEISESNSNKIITSIALKMLDITILHRIKDSCTSNGLCSLCSLCKGSSFIQS